MTDEEIKELLSLRGVWKVTYSNLAALLLCPVIMAIPILLIFILVGLWILIWGG